MEPAIFIIEGGRALEMVKEHIADRSRVRRVVLTLIKELGVEEASINRFNGVLCGVVFKGEVHPEFCRPRGRHGVSSPRKGTSWNKQFKGQHGYKEVAGWIAGEFSIPTVISYRGKDSDGSRLTGSEIDVCGFLFLGEDGPYAMWTPNVPAEVAAAEAEGCEVEGPAKSFKLEFNGCRRIKKENWQILAQRHQLTRGAITSSLIPGGPSVPL